MIWTRPKKRDGFVRHLHDHGNALKTRHVFSAEFKSVMNWYFFKKQLLRARSRCWLSYPFISGISWITFIVRYFWEKSVIQKIWQKIRPLNFHPIGSNILKLNCSPLQAKSWVIIQPICFILRTVSFVKAPLHVMAKAIRMCLQETVRLPGGYFYAWTTS